MGGVGVMPHTPRGAYLKVRSPAGQSRKRGGQPVCKGMCGFLGPCRWVYTLTLGLWPPNSKQHATGTPTPLKSEILLRTCLPSGSNRKCVLLVWTILNPFGLFRSIGSSGEGPKGATKWQRRWNQAEMGPQGIKRTGESQLHCTTVSNCSGAKLKNGA